MAPSLLWLSCSPVLRPHDMGVTYWAWTPPWAQPEWASWLPALPVPTPAMATTTKAKAAVWCMAGGARLGPLLCTSHTRW